MTTLALVLVLFVCCAWFFAEVTENRARSRVRRYQAIERWRIHRASRPSNHYIRELVEFIASGPPKT